MYKVWQATNTRFASQEWRTSHPRSRVVHCVPHYSQQSTYGKRVNDAIVWWALGVQKLLGTNWLSSIHIRPSYNHTRKSRTTNEASQAKHAPFPFSPIGHARVGSISKRDKGLVHWSNTHFISQSLIIKVSIPLDSTLWELSKGI